MQINELPTIPQAPADADVMAIEVNGVTYKVNKQALATAILGQIGASDNIVDVEHGGTGAASASAARTALGITPANIGAVAKTGDTLTGVLSMKSTSVDISAEDNGVSSTTNFNPVQMRDKDSDVFGLFGSVIYANGDVRNRISVTNGGSSASFSIGKHKDGSTYYAVDDASALRTALDVYSKTESQSLPVSQIGNITITTSDSRLTLNQANVFRCGNVVFGYIVLNVDSSTTAWQPGANGIRFNFNNLPAPRAYVTIPTIWVNAHLVNIVSNAAWSVNMRLVGASSVSASGTMSFNVCYIAN